MEKETIFTKEDAKKLNILDVAYSLNMTMIKTSRNEYYWQEHDSFKINIDKNKFNWYSRDISGDTIKMVQIIKEVSFKEALEFLETGEFKQTEIKETKKEPFIYKLKNYEIDFEEGRKYLKENRGLSDDTINFFLETGNLALVNKKSKDGYEEKVIVFKYLDEEKNIIGASMQGITPNKERYKGKGYLKQIIYGTEGNAGFNVNIGEKVDRLIFFEAPIDMMSYYELHKEKLNNVKLISMEGLKEIVVARYFTEHILTEAKNKENIDLAKANTYLDFIIKETTYFDEEKNHNTITMAVDNDKAGKEFIEKLKQKGIKLVDDLPGEEKGKDKVDWNDILKNKKGVYKEMNIVDRIKNIVNIKNKEEREQEESIQSIQSIQTDTMDTISAEQNIALEKDKKNNLEETRQNKNVEGTIGDLVDRSQQATPLPEVERPQLLNDLSPNQTQPQPLLYFNISSPNVSMNKRNYHVIRSNELRKLNRYAIQIQQVAKWYLNNLADTKVNYLYKDNTEINNITVEFRKEHFMHLTGIFPIREGQTAEQTLIDFANGNGNFENIMLANSGATFDKLRVLPELEQILETNAFYFNDLTDIDKFNRLDLSKAIQTEDKDLLLLLRQEEQNLIPASVMKITNNLKVELDKIEEKAILGIYREKDGKLEQISINEKYVKDNGKEMLDILVNNKLEEEVSKVSNIKSEMKNILFSENIKEIQKETKEKTVQDYIKENDIKGLNEYLKNGIKEYTNSENYKKYLQTMSKFTTYSKRNIDLIHKQKSNATLVASYLDWKTKFSRQVKKGEKGIVIYRPYVVDIKDENGNIMLDEKGSPKQETKFTKTTVFDVSQTEGKELPQPIYEINKEVDGYLNLYKAIKEYGLENNIEIKFTENLQRKIKGAYIPDINTILVKKGLSQGHTIKTIFHELAHAKLHKNSEAKFLDKQYNLQELEAESIAFIVSNHYGLDRKEYSFGYLHSYIEDTKDYKDLEEILENIHKYSKEITSKIDNKLEKIKYNTQTLENKIERMKQEKYQKQTQEKEVQSEKKNTLHHIQQKM